MLGEPIGVIITKDLTLADMPKPTLTDPDIDKRYLKAMTSGPIKTIEKETNGEGHLCLIQLDKGGAALWHVKGKNVYTYQPFYMSPRGMVVYDPKTKKRTVNGIPMDPVDMMKDIINNPEKAMKDMESFMNIHGFKL